MSVSTKTLLINRYALLLGGNFFVIPVKSMDTGKKDHTEFMLASRKYYKLYDSYKIFDTKTLKQL